MNIEPAAIDRTQQGAMVGIDAVEERRPYPHAAVLREIGSRDNVNGITSNDSTALKHFACSIESRHQSNWRLAAL